MKSLAAVLAAGIALAASAGAANAQISDDVVKIGVLTDMYADASGKGSLAAVQMAVADYGGKVKGKPVEVIAADHQNKPDVGVTIALKWYDNEKVDAIFDLYKWRRGTVEATVPFAAHLAPDQDPRLSEEHDAWRWASLAEALTLVPYEPQQAALRRIAADLLGRPGLLDLYRVDLPSTEPKKDR